MLRLMMDSDSLGALTDRFPLVATYSDLVTNPAALRAELPGAQLLLIDRGEGDPSGEASIADLETGALTVAQFPAWLQRKQADRIPYLTSYCDRDTLPALAEATSGLSFFRWVATLDGTCFVSGYEALTAPAAVQAIGQEESGADLDISLVFDATWHPAAVAQSDRPERELARQALAAAGELSQRLGHLSAALDAHS